LVPMLIKRFVRFGSSPPETLRPRRSHSSPCSAPRRCCERTCMSSRRQSPSHFAPVYRDSPREADRSSSESGAHMELTHGRHTNCRCSRIRWSVLNVRFDHPEGLVDSARDLGKQIGRVGIVQGCCILDGFACASSEGRQRILRRLHVSSPVADVEGILMMLACRR
jgi:hypothetical protein